MIKKIEKRADGSKRVFTRNTAPSKTDQQYKDECDTNYILRKYKQTGVITHLARSAGQFADLSDIPDLLDGYNRIKAAQEGFNSLPATIRNRFNNDFHSMVAFLNDPKNLSEAQELGLREKPPQKLEQPKLDNEPPKTKSKTKKENDNE